VKVAANFAYTFHVQPLRIRDQRNGRQVMTLTLNGVSLSLLGDANDTESRALLAYLFATAELRLTVVREGKMAALVGRPTVVPATCDEEGQSRG
jgi:D-alanyl-D-alanine carboxypeptidase